MPRKVGVGITLGDETERVDNGFIKRVKVTAVRTGFVGCDRIMLKLVCCECYLARQQGEDEENPEASGVQFTYVTEETQLTEGDRDNGATLSANQSLNSRSVEHFPVLPMQHISVGGWLDYVNPATVGRTQECERWILGPSSSSSSGSSAPGAIE